MSWGDWGLDFTAAADEIHFVHSPGDSRYCPKVEAYKPGIPWAVGSIAWQPYDGEVEHIDVHRDHQRQGIGTALFNHAQGLDSRVHHSDALSADGQAFAEALGHDTSNATRKMSERTAAAPEGYTFHEVVPGEMWKAYHGPRDPHSAPAAKLVVEQHEGQPFVSNVSVHPDHRGKGLGAALWNMAGRPLHVPGAQSEEGKAWADKMGGDNLWWSGNEHLRTAGARGEMPPMTMEPFGTKWSDGIMARHAQDGRPLGHLHWHGDGEIESVRVHPDFQRQGVASAMLKHAQADPETYESWRPIHHSLHLTGPGRAWANSDSTFQDPGDEHVQKADDDVNNWGWTAVKNYVPKQVPYNGQNEDEMSQHLYPDQPHLKQPYKLGAKQNRWPRKWGGNHPDVPFDKRWSPNHPQHLPGPFEY